MAKRRRLGGPLQDYLAPAGETRQTSAAAAPIAQVAGDAAARAAFDEVSRELTEARSEGRLVQRLPLEAVEASWLVRDRAHPGAPDDPEFMALVESLRRHGQRTPIEVTELGQGRYGLISGWRRMTALRRLHEETGETRFATVLAFLRQPASSEDAYVAMVEENEIRLGLSFYERARIVARAVEAEVFPTPKAALQSLFASASRAKRSKIGSFLRLYQVLGESLRFPEAVTERQGLALVRLMETDPGAGRALRDRLAEVAPDGLEAEQRLISDFVETGSDRGAPAAAVQSVETQARPETSARPKTSGSNKAKEVSPGIFLTQRGGRLQLSGPAVGPDLRDRLETWLRESARD